MLIDNLIIINLNQKKIVMNCGAKKTIQVLQVASGHGTQQACQDGRQILYESNLIRSHGQNKVGTGNGIAN